ARERPGDAPPRAGVRHPARRFPPGRARGAPHVRTTPGAHAVRGGLRGVEGRNSAGNADARRRARRPRYHRQHSQPGPTDTGWGLAECDPAEAMPFGRWGKPNDAARLIAWLCSDEARWITGQTINAEGGFRRSR